MFALLNKNTNEQKNKHTKKQTKKQTNNEYYYKFHKSTIQLS